MIRLPRLSNFTDFAPLERHEALGVRYVSRVEELGRPDGVLLPGTKNTMGDLLWLRQNGLEAEIKKLAAQGTPLLGICGGYQMLGRSLSDPDGMEEGGMLAGMGLLPCDTVFLRRKIRRRTRAKVVAPMLAGGNLAGYEIHMGETTVHGAPFCRLDGGKPEGAVQGLSLIHIFRCGVCFGKRVGRRAVWWWTAVPRQHRSCKNSGAMCS